MVMRPLGGSVLVAEERHRHGHAEAEQLLRVALARLAHLDQRSCLRSLHTPTDAGGVSDASAIGVRGLCDRGACRVRRPPDPAPARGGRAAPWLVPPASWPPVATGAWQIVAGRVRPHEKHITRTACAPGARCGARAARSTRRADENGFQGASSAGLAPACPDGRIDRMMTRFLRWRTSRTTAPVCWPLLRGANRGSTDLNWVLMGAERVCRTFLRSVLYLLK